MLSLTMAKKITTSRVERLLIKNKKANGIRMAESPFEILAFFESKLMIAFVFGIPFKRAFPLITIGILIAGLIVSFLTMTGIAIEGSFSLPPLANLSAEDQVFVMAFIRCHGSIKDMEQMFGISYPTVKNRINRIAGQLEFVEIERVSPKEEVIFELERGDITAEEAIRRLSK